MTPETLATTQTAIIGALLAALVTIIGMGANYIKKWLEVKTAVLEVQKAKLEAEKQHAAAEFGLKRLDHIVSNVVAEVEQAKPTGSKPTSEDNSIRLSNAKAEVASQVKPEIMAAVATVVKDPERYITTKIEKAVGDLKLAKTTAECGGTVK
jgi:membrane-associated protease RseP (regulator of RpoE activity)